MSSLAKKTVFVGLSGGVDSSVTAALLKKAGYTVVGVFIRTWQPDFIECSFKEDRLDAMRVAAHLDIPFLECDAEEEYKRAVADYMIEAYKAGRTPNPDVMCNREIKFGVFWKFAKERGADYIATGHYAKIQLSGESFQLSASTDTSKDQSYFLYRLTSDDLSHVLFPLGNLLKSEVRELAKKFGLPTARKKDSQGICMLGDLDIKEFLSHYVPPVRGDVLNESGEVVGHHDGAMFLTFGERHGFTITKKTPSDAPLYIVGKDVIANTITVAPKDHAVSAGERTEIVIDHVSWVVDMPPSGSSLEAQVRYHGERIPCSVRFSESATTVSFEKSILVAPGQSIVIYEGDVCHGGGIAA